MSASASTPGRIHKRVIRDEESEEEDENLLQRPSEPARPRKTRRRSTPDSDAENVPPTEGDHVESDDDFEDAEAHAQRLARQLVEEVRREKLTQEAKVPRTREVGSGVAQMGIVKRIELQDFMCHENLKVDLGPQINFIIGHNGSGKSAVLTALVVCLGAKANVTNRGTSIKNFIREGANRAEIMVELKNEGPDAYCPDLYGPSIKITRRISKDGASTYFVKSHNGKYAAPKPRAELLAICDCMGIQVDNPVNVLTQDTARAFLKDSTPEEMYKFFLRGTQLLQLSEDYEAIRIAMLNTRNIVAKREELLPTLKQKYLTFEKKVKAMEQALQTEEQIAELKKQIAWAQIREQEEKVEADEAEVHAAEQKYAKIETAMTTVTDAIKILDEEIQAGKVELEEATKRAEPYSVKRKEIGDRLRLQKGKIDENTSQQREMDQSFTRYQQLSNSMQERIDVESKKLADENRLLREKQQVRIDMLESERTELEGKLNESKATIRELETASVEVHQRNQSIQGNRRSIEHEISRLRENIQNLQGQRQDRVRAFGNRMPEVMRIIDGERRWISKPIGPIGMYVSIKQEHTNWTRTLDGIIGRGLSDFIVENHQDQRILQDILKDLCPSSGIIVSKRDNFDFSHGEPNGQFLTILRALQISDDVVMRQMIVNMTIEKTILVEVRHEADKVMQANPHNVRRCYTIDGYDVGTRHGGDSSIAMARFTGTTRLHTDVGTALMTSQNELEEKNRALTNLKEEFADVERQRRELERRKMDLKNAINGLNNEMNRKSIEIQQIRDEMQEDEPSNIAALEMEKKDLMRQMELISHQVGPIREAREQLDAAMDEMKKELTAIVTELNRCKEAVKEIQEQVADRVEAKVVQSSNQDHYTSKLKQQKLKVDSCKAEVEAKRQSLAELLETARAFCPVRPEVTKSFERLSKEIRRLEERLRESEREHGGSLDDMVLAMTQAKNTYMSAKDEVKSMEKFTKDLKAALCKRWLGWKLFRKFIVIRASNNFLMQLSQRGYSGGLKFDHEESKLQVRVQTDDQTNEEFAQDKDPKALSGGEKSFSTICLLIALWESMGCPIRCLDEFDVFMDAVNRRISMRMMIESARSSAETQYILITPQDMSNVNRGPDIHFWEMDTLNDPAHRSLLHYRTSRITNRTPDCSMGD